MNESTRNGRIDSQREIREKRRRDQEQRRQQRREQRKRQMRDANGNTQMENLRQGLLVIATVIGTLLTGFTISYFLTNWIYDLAGWYPTGWLSLIISAGLGLFLIGLGMGFVLNILRARGWEPEARAYRPILTALQQISRGDFNIKLVNTFKENEPLSHLVKQVNAMAEQLGEMEQMRQEFISNVSHEIQSPLTSIRGFAQALQDEDLSPAQRADYLGIIMNESMRLSRISENLLKLASLESDEAKFDPQPYRLDKQISELILACEPQWAGKDLEMEVCLDKVEVTADADLLSQVWTNLIGNSIKFTPHGGRVSVELAQGQESATFKISDTGPGIAEEDRIHLFERFYKADKSRTRSGGGSGLGLAITKKIVEMHHGTIDVASSPGAGATFSVILPLRAQAPAMATSSPGKAQIPTSIRRKE